jgi:two-component system sensor histidine kinase KdpD
MTIPAGAPAALGVLLAVLAVTILWLGLQLRQARAKNAWQGALLAAAAHDLRTPLTTITGAADALVSLDARLAPEKKLELAAAIGAEARRLDRVIAALLNIAGLERAIAADSASADLRSAIAAAQLQLGESIQRSKVSIDLPPEANAVRADPLLLEQILVNLMGNAVRHAGAATAVSLRSEAGAGRVTLYVSDDGPGIDRAGRADAFAPFRKGETSAGHGLGLFIARGLARAMGGDLRLRPGSGPGACFALSLPAAAPPVLEAGEPTKACGGRDG